jgi:hypothetical protein
VCAAPTAKASPSELPRMITCGEGWKEKSVVVGKSNFSPALEVLNSTGPAAKADAGIMNNPAAKREHIVMMEYFFIMVNCSFRKFN